MGGSVRGGTTWAQTNHCCHYPCVNLHITCQESIYLKRWFKVCLMPQPKHIKHTPTPHLWYTESPHKTHLVTHFNAFVLSLFQYFKYHWACCIVSAIHGKMQTSIPLLWAYGSSPIPVPPSEAMGPCLCWLTLAQGLCEVLHSAVQLHPSPTHPVKQQKAMAPLPLLFPPNEAMGPC